MADKKRIIVIFLFCLAIGLALVLQARITDGQRLYVSATTIDDYTAIIEAEKKSIQEVQMLIKEAEKKLSFYQEAVHEYDEDATLEEMEEKLEEELLQLKLYTGAETAEGPGVVITIDDGNRKLYSGEDVNNLLVHDIDLLMVINELKRCGAEAISVNGQRIINGTSIACSGYTVRINGNVYARPFIIEAIGDGKRMVSALMGSSSLNDLAPEWGLSQGYGASLKSWGVQFSIELEENLVIEGVSDGYPYAYMERVKGEKET